MAKFDEMDEKVTNVSPVFLINKFNMKPEEADQFLKAWADDNFCSGCDSNSHYIHPRR